jgi:hypothetical protein
MATRITRLGVVLWLSTAWLMPTAAIAEPITNVDQMLVGDGFILRWGLTLTPEDLGLLEERDDQGWHLGWFKQKLRDAAFTVPLPSLPGGSSSPDVLMPPSSVQGGADLASNASSNEAVPQVTLVSEPTSMVLLASGLLGLAAFRRWRYAGD